MERMTFTVDRTTVTEGEVVEVRWSCPGSEASDLTIDNGFKATTLSLSQEGSKRFRLNRSKGRTKLTITAHVSGKPYSKTLKVRVKEIPLTKAETVNDRGFKMDWLERLRNLPKWQSLKFRYRQAWQAMSREKRLAARLLLILGAVSLLSTLIPGVLFLGLFGLLLYLMWFILRK